MDHTGIDVHKKDSQLCIPGAAGELSEPRIRTTPERFPAVLGDRPQVAIGPETRFTGKINKITLEVK